MSGGCIGIITWDACDYCANYSEEDGCIEIIGYRSPMIELDMEDVICLDYEERENGV